MSEPAGAGGSPLDGLLDRLEELLAEVDRFEAPMHDQVFELLDGIDALHRLALTRLGEALGAEEVSRLAEADPAIGWLFQAYGLGVNDIAAASAALDQIRPYLREHGGEVEVLQVENGVVRVSLRGACSGCTASSVTLQLGVEEALRTGLPGFVAMEVEADHGASHPPPGPTLLQIQPRPA